MERNQKLTQGVSRVSQGEGLVEELTDLMWVDGVRDASRMLRDGKESKGSKRAVKDKKKLGKQGVERKDCIRQTKHEQDWCWK